MGTLPAAAAVSAKKDKTCLCPVGCGAVSSPAVLSDRPHHCTLHSSSICHMGACYKANKDSYSLLQVNGLQTLVTGVKFLQKMQPQAMQGTLHALQVSLL